MSTSHLVFLRAFYDLGTCRPAAFDGLSPIPWTAIVTWFDRSPEFMPEDFDGFLSIIRQLDAAYIKWAEDNKPKGKKTMKDRGEELKSRPNRPKRPVKRPRKR